MIQQLISDEKFTNIQKAQAGLTKLFTKAEQTKTFYRVLKNDKPLGVLIPENLWKDFVEDYVGVQGKKLRVVKNMVEENSFGFLLILNSFYFFPSTLAHVVAGLTKTRFWKFIIPTMIGNFINFFFLGLLTLGISEGNYNYVYLSFGILVLNF